MPLGHLVKGHFDLLMISQLVDDLCDGEPSLVEVAGEGGGSAGLIDEVEVHFGNDDLFAEIFSLDDSFTHWVDDL